MPWIRIVMLLSMLAPIAVVRAAQEPTNKPDYCENDGDPDPVHECACHQMCDPTDKDKQGGEDPMCKNYCTKDHCHCMMHCDGTR